MCHIEFPHAGAHVDILVAPVALLAYRGVGESLLGELSQGLPGQDVPRAPSKVALEVQWSLASSLQHYLSLTPRYLK